MRTLPCFRDIPVAPLTGGLDLRSVNGSLGLSNYRVVLNMSTVEEGKVCRMGGWKKLFSSALTGFMNQDLHDHLLCYSQYYQQFDFPVLSGGGLAGWQYPYVMPAYGLEQFQNTYSGVPQCGYFLDFYDVYNPGPGSGEGCWFDRVKVGYPYVFEPGAATDLNYYDQAGATTTSGTTINWNRPHVLNGFDYLDELEAVNGPSAAITNARTFLGVYATATNATTDAQGSFSGTTGLVSWQYTLEHDAESNTWTTDYQFWAAGVAFFPPCSTGPPNYYAGSYFYLGCTDQTDLEFASYGYGPLLPSYYNTGAYDYSYCGASPYVREGCREAWTLIFEFTSDTGTRRLIAASQSRIVELNERTGNWRILADGLGGVPDAQTYPCAEKAECGCGTRRFKVATMGNYAIFTNNFDYVRAYRFEDIVTGCDLTAAKPIVELYDLGIERAKVVAAWKGFVFIGNVTENGQVFANRLMWSNFNEPLIWTPTATGEASFQDLGFGQRILAIEPLGDFLFIYTDTAIHQVVLVGGDELFRIREIYSGSDGLKFVNTLVNTGDAHVYMGDSAIYAFTLYDTAPKRIEWIHKADGAIYKGLSIEHIADFPYLNPFGPVNKDQCDQAVGGYHELEKVLWFSWPTDDNTCPNMTLTLNLRYQTASIVDHGFTAFGNYRSDTRPNIRDFLREQQICQPSAFGEPVKEGPTYPGGPEVPFPNPPDYIWNSTEDPALPASANSLCSRLGDLRIEDLCELCDLGQIFIMASASDYTLKQYTPDQYYRERFTSVGVCPYGIWATVSDGSQYCADGYSSMMQSDMNNFGIGEEKLINNIVVDYEAEEQTTPNKLKMQLAYGAQPKCTTWKNIGSRDLKCLTDASAAEHAANNTRPGLEASFKPYYRGRYIGWRFYVDAADDSGHVTGGGSCFNSLTPTLRQIQANTRNS